MMQALQDPDEFAVQGAVRVLKEFSRDLTDSQIPRVAPVILPDMYRIFMEQEKYTVRTRARAIEIFNTMATMICAMGETDKAGSRAILQPVLPTFTEALVVALKVPDESHLTDAGLKTEVLKGKILVFHLVQVSIDFAASNLRSANLTFLAGAGSPRKLFQSMPAGARSSTPLCALGPASSRAPPRRIEDQTPPTAALFLYPSIAPACTCVASSLPFHP